MTSIANVCMLCVLLCYVVVSALISNLDYAQYYTHKELLPHFVPSWHDYHSYITKSFYKHYFI